MGSDRSDDGGPTRVSSGTQSVERALAVLRCLGTARNDLGVTELAARTGLTVSTTHRLLQALRADGIVAHDERTHRYHLGATLVALGRRAEVVLAAGHSPSPPGGFAELGVPEEELADRV